MTKTSLWLAMLPIAAALAACAGQSPAPTEAPATEPLLAGVATEMPGVSPTEAMAAGTPYHSPAGFALMVPASWDEQYTVEELAGAQATEYAPKAQTATRFMYTPTDPSNQPSPLLVIYTISRADWTAMSAEPGPPIGTMVGQSGDTVFVASTPQSNPYDSSTPDGQAFDAMYISLNLKEDFSVGG